MNTLSNVKDIVEIFTIFDDLAALLQLNKQIAGRKPSLNLAEIATIALIRSELWGSNLERNLQPFT
jgi:hypothetical protein